MEPTNSTAQAQDIGAGAGRVLPLTGDKVSPQQILQWFRDLRSKGLLFHPDDDPETVGCFTPSEVEVVRHAIQTIRNSVPTEEDMYGQIFLVSGFYEDALEAELRPVCGSVRFEQGDDGITETIRLPAIDKSIALGAVFDSGDGGLVALLDKIEGLPIDAFCKIVDLSRAVKFARGELTMALDPSTQAVGYVVEPGHGDVCAAAPLGRLSEACSVIRHGEDRSVEILVVGHGEVVSRNALDFGNSFDSLKGVVCETSEVIGAIDVAIDKILSCAQSSGFRQ